MKYHSRFNFNPLATYGIIVAGSIAIVFSLRFIRLELFIGPSFDTAYYLQALWRLSQFELPITNFTEIYEGSNTNLIFANHFQYSILLYIPLFWLSNSPLFVGEFLIPFITLVLTLYWWHQLFPDRDSLLWGVLGFILLLWSPYSGIFSDEFYFDMFSVPWVLASLFFLREKREIPFLISLFIVVGFKLYFASFAALACFLYYAENRSKKAVWAGLFFIFYFLFILIVAIPYFFNSDSALKEYVGLMDIEGSYAWLAYLFERSFNWESLGYLLKIIGTFLFIPIISPRLSFLALPILGINCLFFTGVIPGPHYHALPNTIFSVAFVYGILDINRHIKILHSRLVGFFTFVIVLVIVYSSLNNTLYRLREDFFSLRSQPAYISEIRDALSKIQPEEEISIVPKLTPYVLKNSGWVFPKPFNQKNLGNKVKRVIIAKHHQSYLNPFGGNSQEFYKYIEFLKEEYNMNVEVESVSLVVLTK